MPGESTSPADDVSRAHEPNFRFQPSLFTRLLWTKMLQT
jgi:hypothetical protein